MRTLWDNLFAYYGSRIKDRRQIAAGLMRCKIAGQEPR
jgi:hypothetical protein